MNSIKAIVADTYLSYDSDVSAADAFDLFTLYLNSESVRVDPRFSLFTKSELVDEMMLLHDDISKLLSAKGAIDNSYNNF